MPKLLYPLPETQMSISRPVILSVIRALNHLTEIKDDTPIIFNGASDLAISFNATTGSHKPFDSAKFNHYQKVQIVTTERAAEDDLLTQRVHHHDALLCFWDEALRIEAKPVYSRTECVVSFTFRAADRRSAEAWRDSIRSRVAMGRAEITHQADYEYGIPPEYYLVLHELHRLREAQGGYNQTFKEWFMASIPEQKFTVLTKLDGTEPHPVFKETQMNFIGAFDFTGEPEATKNSDSPTWEISVDYKFFYDKPIQMSLVYPQFIHNQLLDEKWRGVNTNTSYARMLADRSHMQRSYDYMRQLTNFYFGNTEGLKIPYFDEWSPLHQQPDYSQLFQVAICIDPANPTELVSIQEFEDPFTEAKFEWQPYMLDFLRLQGDRIFRRTKSIFFATVVEDQDWLDPTQLVIDNDLNLYRVQPCNIRKQYHLRFYILNDLTKLDAVATEELLNNPQVCLPVLDSFLPGAVPKVIGDRLVVRRDYLDIIAKIRDKSNRYSRGSRAMSFNVGCYTIVTHKQGDLDAII